MSLKRTILSTLGRDDLKHIVDDLEIDGVDRRSADGMKSALSRSRKTKPEDLLGYLRKPELQTVCEELGLPTKGKRDEIVDRILNGKNGKAAKKSTRRKMNQEVQQKLDLKDNGQAKAQPKKKPEKLTLARLEGRLFKACDILRGLIGKLLIGKLISNRVYKCESLIQGSAACKGGHGRLCTPHSLPVFGQGG